MTQRQLVSRWNALLPGRPDLGADLVRRYAEPARHYHNLVHLQAVLDAVAALAQEAAQPRLVLLASWYHDAVYDARRVDNEERSAQLAEQTLAEAGLGADAVREVARLVRLTMTHDAAVGDRNGAVLCDADLAILAADEVSYASYTAEVRAEYAEVGEDDFRRGRSAVLQQLLSSPSLFHTALGSARWEAAARVNVSFELARLR